MSDDDINGVVTVCQGPGSVTSQALVSVTSHFSPGGSTGKSFTWIGSMVIFFQAEAWVEPIA